MVAWASCLVLADVVVIFWGIGLVFHAWFAFGKQEATETEVQAEIRRMKGPGPGAGDQADCPVPRGRGR